MAENWHHPCIASRPVFIEANALRTFVFYPFEGIPVPDALELVYVVMNVPLLRRFSEEGFPINFRSTISAIDSLFLSSVPYEDNY
jgi:hypothetical protein